jgi:hypothetical protein
MKQGLSWILVGAIGLSGCGVLPWEPVEPQQSRLPDRWRTYRNPRFGFEFLYPEGWIDSIPPENQDGIAFNDPRNSGLEIRSWAKLKRSENSAQPKPTPNFTTEQGIPGRIDVKVEAQSSVMMLTIAHKDVEYQWRGVAPSNQFGNYYRFFSFIASRYRVPE